DPIGRVGLMRHPDWPVDTHTVHVRWTIRRSACGQRYAPQHVEAPQCLSLDNLALRRGSTVGRPSSGRPASTRQQSAETLPGAARGASRAVAWLATRQAPDGLLGSEAEWLAASHKGLAAFGATGRTREAGRLATWLRTNRLQPDGDLGAPANRDPSPVWLYFNAWIAWGAHRVGRF